MAESGADVLELDHQVDITTACRTVGPEIAVWGNLDPVRVLAQGTPEQVREKTLELLHAVGVSGHRRMVVSSGCTLSPDTPTANLTAMLDTVRSATGFN
jgi:uroporphyrinogen-III decarboxylase